MHAFWIDRRFHPVLTGSSSRQAVSPTAVRQPVSVPAVKAAGTVVRSTRLCLGIGDGNLRRQ
ncbi:hypothetical protein [Dyella mobilis]|uniref:Uncharacterized protein n=1 Tax=Dyella mobilis TaxID=1849582 RepID=A0ABS2KDL8_9GAMM|nr:hypothetical protein [Dyella mobilis]MBM7129257.1 hypothetical protein [Dyella mobilis]